MSRVFIVHETLTRQGGRTKNLQPARQFGEFIHLVNPGPQPEDLASVLPQIKYRLMEFTPDDYLIPIGHPILIGWATAIAADNTGGSVKLLYWNNNKHCYETMPAKIY